MACPVSVLDLRPCEALDVIEAYVVAGGRPEEAIEYAKMALRIDPGCVY